MKIISKLFEILFIKNHFRFNFRLKLKTRLISLTNFTYFLAASYTFNQSITSYIIVILFSYEKVTLTLVRFYLDLYKP